MPPTVALVPPNQPPAAVAPDSRRQVAPEAEDFKPFGKDGLTFDDVLDVINPLHHLPIVGAIYRDITGDTISAASKVTGGALFGGPIGLAAAVADTVLRESSGQDAGGHVLALMKDAQTGPDEIPSQPGGSEETPLSETASLRHDANEHEDGQWEDPDAPAGPENVAASKPSASAAPAAFSPVTGSPARNTIRPGAALNGGPRALGAALPAPRALAANPATVTAFRKGESRYFRPGGTVNTDAWLKLMSNVGANRGRNAAPTGPRGLASGLTVPPR